MPDLCPGAVGTILYGSRFVCGICGATGAVVEGKVPPHNLKQGATMPKPASNSIITLREKVLDSNGDLLPVGLDVVVLEAYDDGSILVAAENEAEEAVDAWLHEGEWSQRPG